MQVRGGKQQRLTLLTVNGHPDDETVSAGGAMARYAAEGLRVVCVVATRGELGEIITPDLQSPENYQRLGEIREQELIRALARLGPIEHEFLGYRDSGTMGTPGNLAPGSFWQADLDEAVGRLVKIIRKVQADVIVGPNAYGSDGHPDHMRASAIAKAAYDRAGDPSAYPEQLEGGLQPWAPSKLYETVDQFDRRQKLLRALRSGGLTSVVPMVLRVARHWSPAAERKRRLAAAAQGPVTTRVDVSPYIPAKLCAMAEHRTQIAPNSARFALTAEERQRVSPTENFTLRASRVEARLPEDDLFSGLR
jgi:N-acetyl-1-D-myo-inositol-2-amino-2-deoxy-alpha-D-glucopyranoside deacetylase